MIEKYLKTGMSLMKKKKKNNGRNNEGREKMYRQKLEESFVKQGKGVQKKRSKEKDGWWNDAHDWSILMDTREKQYQIPQQIAASPLRPDICMYSLEVKSCVFLELTSPFEDNIYTWKVKKRDKYRELVMEAERNGWKVKLFTAEVGARGFVNMDSLKIYRSVGLSHKQCSKIRKEMSEVSIRCSHFIWLNRDNREWMKPMRVVL